MTIAAKSIRAVKSGIFFPFMRLDKFVSHATGLSRKQVKQILARGEIHLGDQVLRNPSLSISEDAELKWHEKPLRYQKHRYLMLHKPTGYICANHDRQHPTVMALLGEERSGLHVAGRLDRDTTGLVLLSDDGAWSHRLTSPHKQCFKRYRVQLTEPLSQEAAAQLQTGLLLRGEKHPTKAARLEPLSACEVLLSIQEGRYHQVKRMFAAVGNHVIKLHREAIGDIELDPSLPIGAFRPLSRLEIDLI